MKSAFEDVRKDRELRVRLHDNGQIEMEIVWADGRAETAPPHAMLTLEDAERLADQITELVLLGMIERGADLQPPLAVGGAWESPTN